MKYLAPLFVLAPSAALAHDGPLGHAHPHGLEIVAWALAAAAVGWLVWKLSR